MIPSKTPFYSAHVTTSRKAVSTHVLHETNIKKKKKNSTHNYVKNEFSIRYRPTLSAFPLGNFQFPCPWTEAAEKKMRAQHLVFRLLFFFLFYFNSTRPCLCIRQLLVTSFWWEKNWPAPTLHENCTRGYRRSNLSKNTDCER